MKSTNVQRLALGSLCLGLALALPFLTGQIPYIGSMLLPMHLPVLICGFLCGWPYGLLVGFAAPLLRSVLFGMPPLMPTALCMAVEMAAYGGAAGLFYTKLPQMPWRVYAALIAALLIGRIAWGLVSLPIYALFTENTFTMTMFWTGAFVRAWPGIVIQLVLVPLVIYPLERAKLLPLENGQKDMADRG